MATIKAFTDLQQSKKLAEILPLESADMRIGNYVGESGKVDGTNIHYYPEGESFGAPQIIKAWSLAALLSVLPDYTLQTNTDGTVFVVCDSKKPMVSDAYNNPVDACYEMIIHLHELKIL